MTLQGFFDVIQTTLEDDTIASDMSSSTLNLVIGTETITASYTSSTDTVELNVKSAPTDSQV